MYSRMCLSLLFQTLSILETEVLILHGKHYFINISKGKKEQVTPTVKPNNYHHKKKETRVFGMKFHLWKTSLLIAWAKRTRL